MPADDRFEQTTHAPLRYVVKSCRVLGGIFTDTCTGIYAIGVIEQSLSMLSVHRLSVSATQNVVARHEGRARQPARAPARVRGLAPRARLPRAVARARGRPGGGVARRRRQPATQR